jgi:hypothetical protein
MTASANIVKLTRKENKIMARKAPDAAGMSGYRSRNTSGPLRQKRSDTHVKTIEKQYGTDFKVRGDMQLGTLLKKEGVKSLNDLMQKRK